MNEILVLMINMMSNLESYSNGLCVMWCLIYNRVIIN